MSSDKKSPRSIILLLLVFALVAGMSWFFFNNSKHDGMNNKDEMAEHLDEDMGHDHDHDHNKAETSAADNNEQIGVKGKIHQLNQSPLYGVRGVGNPNAPIKIQEFFSLTCNHCANFYKDEYPIIKTNLIDTGKVYFVYEEFPLNGPALYGSMIARCLPQERYNGFIDILLTTQDKWAFSGDFKEALKQNAKLAGMSEEEFDTCFSNTELQKAIATNIQEASEVWKVNSTPSFVINDGERIIYGAQPAANFEKLVEQLTNGTTSSTTETSIAPKAEITDKLENLEDSVKDIADDVQDVIKENTETIEQKIE